MLRNATYDLMETASVLSQGLYRYATFARDGEGCPQCQQIWQWMQQTDEEQLRRVVQHLKQHLDDEIALKIAS